MQMAEKNLPPAGAERKILGEAQIRKSVSDLLSYTDPVARATNRMQKDGTTIAKAVEIWLDLIEEFPDGGPKNLANKRSHVALETPFFLLANILDPRF